MGGCKGDGGRNKWNDSPSLSNRKLGDFFATYKAIGAKSVQLLDQVRQILQIIEGLDTVLLGCFIEKYTPNGQIRVGRVGRPRGICLYILAH